MLLKSLLLRPFRFLPLTVGSAFYLAASVAGAIPSSPEIIFQDTFDKRSDSTPGAPWGVVAPDTPQNNVLVVPDTDNYFGDGPSNYILEYRKKEVGESQALIAEKAFSAEIARIRFQFYQPDDKLDGYSWIMLYAGSRSTNNRAQVVTIGRSGSLAGNNGLYERGQKQDVVLVVNNSDLSTVYDNNQPLAPGSVDIWINGKLTHAGFSHQNNQRGPLTGFEINTSGKYQQHFYIDNLRIEKLEQKDVPVGVAAQPGTHPPLTPIDGQVVAVNPPPMIWQHEDRASSYILEFSRERSFSQPTARIENLDLPFTITPKPSPPAPGFGVILSLRKKGKPSVLPRFSVFRSQRTP